MIYINNIFVMLTFSHGGTNLESKNQVPNQLNIFRAGEENGKAYHFVTKEAMETAIGNSFESPQN